MLTTVLLVILVLVLLGGFLPWGAGPPVAPGQPMEPAPLYRGYGYGWGVGGPIGIILVILVVLLMGGL